MNATNFTTATSPALVDSAFTRGRLFLRWGLLVSYVGLVYGGILDVTATALFWSALPLLGSNVYHTARYTLRVPPGEISNLIHRHIDVVLVTLALIALHDVRNPIWAVYFLGITSLAHLLTRRAMVEHVAFTMMNYLAFAAITAALGTDVSWPYVSVVATLIGFMAVSASIIAGSEQRLREVIAIAASTDSLTGLPNRRHFQQQYYSNLDEAIAQRIPLALMLLDVDHFKLINDRDGHPAGDDKLREVAAALRGVMRQHDMVARYGGDEFIVVAPHTTRADALTLAERLRTAALTVNASISVGVALYPDDAELHDRLIDAADAALYQAKQAGRNCVRIPNVA
jgi:diguanylate cyclase (GGDEF)-like protein